MTTGDGGMICLNNKNKFNKLKSLSFHGWNKDPWQRHQKSFGKKNYYTNHWNYEIVNLGYKYNMNDLMAAIGIGQLKKINILNKKRGNFRKMCQKEEIFEEIFVFWRLQKNVFEPPK